MSPFFRDMKRFKHLLETGYIPTKGVPVTRCSNIRTIMSVITMAFVHKGVDILLNVLS